VVWKSGKIASNASTYVPYTGAKLLGGTTYQWTVRTTTTSASQAAAEHQSVVSSPAVFVTALLDGWNSTAKFISLVPSCVQSGAVLPQVNCSWFGYFRTEVTVPRDVLSAAAFITAQNWGIFENMLANYKLYVEGELVGLGPGRGEASVWAGQHTFHSLPIDTLDVTTQLRAARGRKVTLAIEAYHHGGPTGPQPIMQLNLVLSSGRTATIVTDGSWTAFNGDLHRKPGPALHGGSAGTASGIEYIDARYEPTGWKRSGFQADSRWSAAIALPPAASQLAQFTPKMEPPMQFNSFVAARSMTKVNETFFIADFGRELQGAVRLNVEDGKAGQTVHIACGEALVGTRVGSTWGWEFDWVLRDGEQELEQHKYMECRWVSVIFNGTAAPSNFSVSAWQVQYPYDQSDSHFNSSSSMLNAVFELCRYTLEAASLDTYTDSNTRERRPYEADGIIAASGRSLLQRDFMWARHSHAWVINNPTWPVEWRQLSAFLGWHDYMATGTTDLAMAFAFPMYNRTMIPYLESSTGLLNTARMGESTCAIQHRSPCTRDPNHPYGHIVDWMPNGQETDQTTARGEMSDSNHTSVSNMMGAHGLELLATMLRAGRDTANATSIAAQATALKRAIIEKMWNGTHFCDGICAEVGGNSSLMTNIFALCFGMVPAANAGAAWQVVTDWGLEQIGDYGAFWYMMAVAGGYYTDATAQGKIAPYALDDGSAILTALTKCDNFSWCSGLRDDNLTMTRESWHDGTYSHEWGTSAIVGVAWGVMGVHQTSPGWATFTVKPKLGSLQHASITVPTLRGYIKVTAPRAGGLAVHVPCNSFATLCLPRRAGEALLTELSHALLLDGDEVQAISTGGHMCAAKPVSCGRNDAPRVLATLPKNATARPLSR
jgi:hypothetical protein